MNRFYVVLFSIFFSAGSSSHAAIHTFDFSGAFGSSNFDSGSDPEFDFAAGTTYSGSLQFNDAIGPDSSSGTSANYETAVSNFSFTIDGQGTLTGNSTLAIIVSDEAVGPNFDQLTVVAFDNFGGGSYQTKLVWAADASTLSNNTPIPDFLSFISAAADSVVQVDSFLTGESASHLGGPATFNAVAAPAPGAPGLLLVSCLGMSWRKVRSSGRNQGTK